MILQICLGSCFLLKSQFYWCPASPSPTPFSFYEGPRAKADGPWAQYYHQLFLSDPSSMQRKSKSQTIIIFLNPWLDVGLCDFLQWQPTEWRVMFQISGLDFLPPSQMDLEDHSTTLNNISKITKIAKQMLTEMTSLEQPFRYIPLMI